MMKQMINRKTSKEELYKLYWEKEYSFTEIAKIFNCAYKTIGNKLEKFGIKARTTKEAKNTKRHITKFFGKNAPRYKNGQYKDAQGYIYVLIPEHPRARRNYIKRAHLVLEKKLGRYLYSGEIAHHKNEIRDDDRAENIELKESRSAHIKHHNQIKRLK